MVEPHNFRSALSLTEPGVLTGYVFHPDAPDRLWSVGLVHNGRVLSMAFADAATPADLHQPGLPDQCGFSFNVTGTAFQKGDTLEVQVININYIIGAVDLQREEAWRRPMDDEPAGYVRHANGLTLTGLFEDEVTRFPSYEVLAFDGDEVVGRTRIYRWQHVGNAKNVLGKRVGFEILVDPALADGQPRKLRVETSTGRQLRGSPVSFCAFPNAFREACAALPTRVPSTLADTALYRLLENSIPLSAYEELFSEAELQIAREAAANYTFLSACQARPLQMAVDALAENAAPLVSFDLIIDTRDGPYPALLPAYDHERHLEQGYLSFFCALRSDLQAEALAAGCQTPAAILLHVLERIPHAEIMHLPVPGARIAEAAFASAAKAHRAALAALAERTAEFEIAEEASDTTFPAIRLTRPVRDKSASIIIPTKNQGAMLRDCVVSLRDKNPDFTLDVIIVDNGSDEDETAAILNELEDDGARVLEFDEGFNFSLINTLAAEHAVHEQLCFLNNDVFFPQTGVLEEMCSRLACPKVGAVGPLMVRGTDIIQHGGVVLGPQGGAAHAFEDRMRHDAGYMELLKVAHECSALTGAMLLTRKSLFESMDGFDERLFPVNFNDVDYCLRLREAGHRVVFTPHRYIQHFESVSRGRENKSPSLHRMLREVQNLRARWGNVIFDDPFYHPLFSVDTLPYRALKSRRTSAEPRYPIVARRADVPSWL